MFGENRTVSLTALCDSERGQTQTGTFSFPRTHGIALDRVSLAFGFGYALGPMLVVVLQTIDLTAGLERRVFDCVKRWTQYLEGTRVH
jgi:hypothetical protein